MGKLLLLLVVFTVSVVTGEAALLGAKPCTYGPSYWCDSIRNAKECSAVHHCIQDVWEKKILPVDNDDICTLCKNMVQEARDQLLSNETQEEIREVFDGSCRLIPIKVVADECVHLAEDFIPELIDTLASQMNPQVVCATAGLCNSVKIDMILQGFKNSHPNAIIPTQAVQHAPQQPAAHTPQPGDCEACKDFIDRTIRLVKTHSHEELMNRLMAICSRLGSVSDGCMALVQVNIDTIYDFLTNQLNADDFCDLVEMCEDRMHEGGFYQRPPLPHTGDEACDFCESIVQHWRDVLTSNTTEMEFKQILEGLCKQTGSFAKNCLSLVEEYYLPLYSLLMSEIRPKQICEAVGLCGETSVFKNEYPVMTMLDISDNAVMPLVELQPAISIDHEPGMRMTGMDEAAAISRPLIAVESVGQSGVVRPPVGKGSVGNDNACVMCEFALHFLQNMLEQKDTREDIEHAVEQLCDLMPHSISEECEDYVEAYGDQVIELLAQEMDPSQICPWLNLCPKKVEVAPVRDDVSCVMCEYAMTQLEEMLQDHHTEDDIKHALDQLCSFLPSSVRDECQVFVDTYTDQIIHMLINDFTPDQVCTQLGLCKHKAPRLPELTSDNQLPISRVFVGQMMQPAVRSGGAPEVPHVQSTLCVLCEFAMTQVDNFLQENATVGEIEEVVNFICAHLPGTLADDCIGFVEQYGEAIVRLLVAELDPKTVCQAIKLCKPPRFSGMRRPVDMGMGKCEVCKFVVQELEEELDQHDTVQDLDTLLEHLCSLLPHSAQSQCRNLIEVYGPYLINLLAELSPDQVCGEIHMCPHQQSLLGGEKCKIGPAYWCQTKLHATACQAVTHCSQSVWLNNPPLA